MVYEILYEQCVFGRKEWSKSRPGGSTSGPREARSEPRSTQESLRSLHGRPTSRSNSASERFWRPSGAHLAPGSSPEAYLSRFWTSRGTIFHPPGNKVDVFSKLQGASSKLSRGPQHCVHTTVLCAKLMQAYVQHRSTRLCHYYMWDHFYMWISTATDSRSIDR